MRIDLRSVVLAAGLMAPATAFAQPATQGEFAFDPNFPGPLSFMTGGTAPGEVKWWKLTLTNPARMTDLKFLDIFTSGAGLDDDCEIALYNAAGALISADDDDGNEFNSQLTFGSGEGINPGGLSPTVRNGRDGDLPAGEYYLAVSRWQVTFLTTGFGFTPDGSGAPGDDVTININGGDSAPQAPATITADLGTVAYGAPVSRTDPLAAGAVNWYKVALPSAIAAQGSFIDMDTEGTLLAPANSTRLTIYGANGALQSSRTSALWTDTIDGSNTLSQLTFGLTTPTRAAVGNGLAYNGRDGEVRAATYYVAVSSVSTNTVSLADLTSSVNFGLSSLSANAGDATLRINAAQGNVPPSGTGVAVPAAGGSGDSTVLRVTVTPGTLPPSTSITVVADATSIGAGAAVNLLDNGVFPDLVAGDNVYSAGVVVGPGLPSGAVTIPFVIQDQIPRTGTGNITFQVVGPPPACPTGGESFSATNLPSEGEVVGPDNGVYTFTPVTTTDLVTTVRFSGRFTSSTIFGNDSLVLITPPSGVADQFGFFPIAGLTTVGVPVDVTFDAPVPCGIAPVGEWEVRFLDDFDDAPIPDGVWNNVCVTLVTTPATPGTWNTDCTTDAGELPIDAQLPVGSGPLDTIIGRFDTGGTVDMYRINICDTGAFSASTLGSLLDTQIFLFNLDGTGVIFNDDIPGLGVGVESRIDNSGSWISATGDYYLAVGLYNRDPVDGLGALLWNNTGPGGVFDDLRQPDGPGATNPVEGWVNFPGGGLAYTISFTGTCYPSGGTAGCNRADITDIGDSGAGPDNQLTVDDLIAFVNTFGDATGCPGTAPCNRADITDIGDTGAGPDGELTVDDIIAFVNAFGDGCPA